MKRLIPPLLSAVALCVITGCGSMQFAKFNGEQKSWPTGSSFTDRIFTVPVYRSWPEKPYEVLGTIQFTSAGVEWNDGDIKQAADMARKSGGDAIILMPSGPDPSPTMASVRQQLGLTGQETVAVVAKWK